MTLSKKQQAEAVKFIITWAVIGKVLSSMKVITKKKRVAGR